MDANTSGLKKISVVSIALGAIVVVWGAVCGFSEGFDDARPFFVLLSGVAGALYGFLVLRAVNEGAGLYTLKKRMAASWLVPACMLIGTFTAPGGASLVLLVPIVASLVVSVLLDRCLRKAL